MPKPICVPCKRFFRPFKNGVFALEQMPMISGARPGLEEEALWEPYKVWHADLYRCEGCGHELIVGFGAGRLAEHYEASFASVLPLVTHTVNDC